ncbi:hypothetical protein BMWSH_2326 [Priestia megaterium WSH-002]|uniref:Uncharacterized protein n=1 Tax=Priestia megaterium (strain WSH-002) TaxID=1006007 RepID=A0A8D4BN44_PRIMW|nr:hypothetical protein BMWSH_2326 [Priestia megaterium WSH-002]
MLKYLVNKLSLYSIGPYEMEFFGIEVNATSKVDFRQGNWKF